MSPWLSELFLGSQSDERLVELARAGHDRAFVAIVQRYRRELYAHARRLGADGHAEDIVQQAFLSAFAALRKDTDVAHLRGWLYAIVRHTAARADRGPQGEAELDTVVLAGEPLEDDVDRRMLAFDALSEIGRLPERQRAALIGTAIHGHSRAEVADSLGLSEAAVRQLVHRARASLRTAVTALTPYPFARWLASVRSHAVVDRLQEATVAAGSVSVGGAALKVGALIASGVIATGIVATHQAKRHDHRGAPQGSNGATLPGGGDGVGGARSVGLSPFGIAGGRGESGASGSLVDPALNGSGPNPIGGDGGAFTVLGGGDGRSDGGTGGSSSGGDDHSSGGTGPSSGSTGSGGVGGSDGGSSSSSGSISSSSSGTSGSSGSISGSGSTSGSSGSGDATIASGTPGSDGGSSGSSSGSSGGSGDGMVSTSTSGGSGDSGSDGGSLTSGETSTSSGS